MYFNVSVLLFALVIQVDIRRCPLDIEIFVLFFFYGTTKVCFYLPICSVDFFFFFFHEVRMESCTESISYIQVSSSIIKDQIGVFKCSGEPAYT